MPQETNLNVAPYYDDFDPAKDFHRVLFKPGTPVQARELTGLQSILQNQIEKFGTHFFKEGAKIIPGQLFYKSNFLGVCISDDFQGIPVSLYAEQLVGKRISGRTSGVEVRIDYVLLSRDSERNLTTLYFTPTKSGNDLETDLFTDGEELVLLESISYGNTTISQNQSFATAISLESNISGASANIQEGVYFLRGNFVRVAPQTILINQYDPFPSVKVGLLVQEEIATSNVDESLNDNAQGFSNYSAPGADRLKISATLTSRGFIDTNEVNFIELMRIQNGQIETFVKNTDYNYIKAEFARRTYDESGDYYIKQFNVALKNTLNDLEGNSGLYNAGDDTYQGNTPSDDLMEYIISPGKAYVRGFEIDKQTETVVDIPKPRSTRSLTNQSVPISIGPKLAVNNVHGSPSVGFNTTLTASLRDQRVGIASTLPAGNAIGACRIYDSNLESPTYVDATSEYTLRLFDIVPYTKLQITQPFTSLRAGAFISGQYSGATGFVAEDASGISTFSLQQVKGTFQKGEKISVDGVNYNTTVAISTNYDLSNVKSIYQGTTTGISTFNADLKLTTKSKFANPLTITARSGNPGVSTISAPKGTFVGIITTNDLVRFTSSGVSDPVLLKVQSIGSDGSSIILAGIQTVTNLYDGAPPSTSQTLTNFEVVSGDLINVEDNTLYTTLDNRLIDSVNLTGANITIRKVFDNISSASGSLTLPTAGANEFYQSFDEERYNVCYRDGTIEPLSSDKVTLSANSKVVTIGGLSRTSETNIRVFATLTKNVVTEKKKNLETVSSITITRSSNQASGIGSTSLGDGLTYSNVYGTRVQDREVSLNKPDVLKVVAIYESDDANDPDIPSLSLTSITGPSQTTSDYIIGERIVGSSSKAAALIVSVVNSQKIEIVYLNEKSFILNELVTAEKTGITAVTQNIGISDKVITTDFDLDNGQRKSFYDYGRIVRKKGRPEPKRRIRVIFQNFVVPSGDTGDIFTSESFDNSLYSKSIPTFEGIRNTDIIDIRPRVGDYDTTSVKSPFDFTSRSFIQSGQSASNILVSDENIIISYDYYLGRIDRIFLDAFGKFNIIQGVPSENPEPPSDIDGNMPIATIKLPPYLFSVNSAEIKRVDHKRYRMKDIADLETRITNLEYYTALSLLEKETEALTVQDAKGLDRFKSGFFVDNFKTHQIQDQTNPDFACSIDTFNGNLRPAHFTTSLDLIVATTAVAGIGTSIPSTTDQRYNIELLDPNIRKTGDVVTLNYAELTYMQNSFASRVESVNPFLITTWVGTLKLFPSSDIWVDQKVIATNEYNINGPDFVASVQKLGINEASGFGEIEWGSWQDSVVGRESRTSDSTVVSTSKKQLNSTDDIQTTTTKVVRTTNEVEIHNLTREGVAIRTTPHVEKTTIGNKVLSRNSITFMRSRNIELRGSRLKPRTQVYPVIDSTNIAEYMTPKLLEILMTNGTFEVGETVVGEMQQSAALLSTVIDPSSATIKFRVATSNHKEGPYNAPIQTYAFNPYNIDQVLPSTYSSASTILNVDTSALASKTEGDFFGYVKEGMILRGLTSNAQAVIQSVRLVTDEIGTVAGTIFIPDPAQPSVPQFTTGTKTIKLTSLPNITFISSLNTTSAESTFQASGILEFTEEQVLSVRSTAIHQAVFQQSTTSESIVGSTQAVISETNQDTILRNVRQLPATNCDARYVAYTTAINNGYRSYTAYAQAMGDYAANLIYNTAVLLTRPGAPKECGGTGVRIAVTERYTRDGSRFFIYRPVTDYRVNPRTVIQFRRTGTPERAMSGGRSYNFDSKGNLIATANLSTTRTASTSSKPNCPRDPLAQSFYVNSAEGIFVTSVDVFFQAKDNDLPVTMQIRTMRDGTPTTTVLPFSELDLLPSQVNISDDASVSTKFTFESPVYLQGNQEYAIVLLADTPNYGAWISRMGDQDLTNSIVDPDAPRNFISQQPLLGSLFKSQNGSTWDASQYEDLKFTLYRAQFTTNTTANLTFYNSPLAIGNDGITKLGENPIETISKRVVVGLGSTLSSAQSSTIVPGVRISQVNNSTASGVVINTLGGIGIGASVSIINAGIGYTPSSGYGTYTANLTTLSGSGSGAVASVTVSNGGITSCFITNGGTGYAIGDELGITTLGSTTLGRNARFSVGIISAINSIQLDEVQGEFNTGVGATLTYISQSTGAVTTLTGITASSVTADSYYDGRHFKVRHRMHGMYSGSNIVDISNIKSDTIPTTITSDVTKDSTSNISLASTANFTTFENVGVGTTNLGYALINGEIISYTGISGNTLTGISRNVDNTGSYTHNSGDLISKYELNGVSLRRINKRHTLGDATVPNPRELDYYHVKIDTSTDGINRSVNTSFPKLSFNSTKRSGGTYVISSKNIQFETITPNVQVLKLPETEVVASIRTVSGTSVDGNEISFLDQGYESVSLNSVNNLSTPRLICSKLNESTLLTDLPGNKSFTLDIQMSSTNSFVSPVVDLDRVNMILTSNRLNQPVTNFIESDAVMITGEDPHSAVYVTKKVELANPANSLKVLLNAYRHESADIKILYKIFTNDASIDSTPYNLFPGYANIDDLGNVINPANNDGSSNVFVTPSKPGEFKDYEWFVDDLPEFTAFAIKIIMNGTNQAEPPILKDLRVIAVR